MIALTIASTPQVMGSILEGDTTIFVWRFVLAVNTSDANMEQICVV